MKKIFVCLFALFMVSSSAVFAHSYLGTELPLAGKTQLPQNMQAVVLGYVYSKTARTIGGCKKFMLSDTKVTKEKVNIEYGRNGKEVGGTWSEEWTVNACGMDVVIPIDFTTTGHGVKYDIKDPKQ